jgi:amidase
LRFLSSSQASQAFSKGIAVHEIIDAFSTAGHMLQALRRRQISSVELLEGHLSRISRYDAALNSIVVRDFERAREAAADADARRARGIDAPLLGLPITIKESIDVQGLPSTAGVPARKGHRAEADAITVRRLRAAGAIVFGKTNICQWLADYQGDNPVYGRTSNPWDMTRTSGGSTAGSAALAAGLTPLELGSDMGGSIRVPAAFCGLWGHKPSAGLVPNSGHFPGSAGYNPGAVLAVQGPHGRSPDDLELMLDAVAGPDAGDDVAWRVQLPQARHSQLRHFRVAVLPDRPWVPVDGEIVAARNNAVAALGKAGVAVAEVHPPGFDDFRDHYALFRSMMSALVSVRWPADHRGQVVADKLARHDPFHRADAAGIRATAADYLLWLERREAFRAAWRRFFRDWDILLTPATIVPAFEHSTVPNADRRLAVNGEEVEFEYMSFYPSVPTLAGLPATALPAGFKKRGLPLGLQAVGPLLEDRTPLAFARLLAREFQGFKAPPGYDGEFS